MATCLEDLPTELFYSIFDYFWAHELFNSFSNLNTRIDQILFNIQLYISSELNENIKYSPHNVLSLVLTSSKISIEKFVNLRSLTLIQCNLDNIILNDFPPYLTHLCIKNINLSYSNLKFIFQNLTLINVQLNLYHKIIISSSIFNNNNNNIEYLTINYISLNDIIQLIKYTQKLKYLRVSLYGIDNQEKIINVSPLLFVTRLICLSIGISFDILCSKFLSIYFPNLINLSIFTSFVEQNIFINSLEQLLINNLYFVKKLTISAQFIVNRTLTIENIKIRFRTAFWIKKNCYVTFKYCNNDPHTIRLYLQTNKKLQIRPSRF